MKKYKKIIIILSAICIVFIICLVLLILSNKSNNDINLSKNNIRIEQNEVQLQKKVQELDDIKITYNIGKCINKMIEDYYYSGKFENTDVPLLPSNLVQKLDYDNGLKTYYIDKGYKADLEDNITIYFTKGYIVNDKVEKIQREEILLTLINDTEYNTAKILLYGEGYTDKILYNDDISKTAILDMSGFKIKKTETGAKQLDEIIMEEEIFQNKKLDENIPERDLLNWYYRDYKIKQADEHNEKLEFKGFLYEGNFESGYTITETDRTKYFIKPDKTSMNYYIEKK